jgi:hypothetical protein
LAKEGASALVGVAVGIELARTEPTAEAKITVVTFIFNWVEGRRREKKM